jgi:hypothetical protein
MHVVVRVAVDVEAGRPVERDDRAGDEAERREQQQRVEQQPRPRRRARDLVDVALDGRLDQ